MAEDWITTTDASAISGYHPEYIRWLIREGKIVAKKFGIVWQVNKKSLIDYLVDAEKSSDKRRGSKISKT
jgi:predicted 3-demethylubiquinone-9 3-methyltransferase (glyoxalase superfamily)